MVAYPEKVIYFSGFIICLFLETRILRNVKLVVIYIYIDWVMTEV